MDHLLGIDVGTYSSRATLADTTGRVICTVSRAHDLAVPRAGWAEADAESVWWADVLTLTREILARSGVPAHRIAAVGCSAIAPCVLPVDTVGNPLRPAILYGIDTRSAAEIRELNDTLGTGWILDHTGSALSTQAAGPKILWLRRNQPELWERVGRVMTSTTYLVYRLTGRVVMDHYTAAAYGPLYDVHTRDWSPVGCRPVCDRALLPELGWSGEVAGGVSPEAAGQTGLREGTPVTVGTADAAAEAVAAGVLDPGDTLLMYGSTLFFIQITDRLAHSTVLWPTVYLESGRFALAGGMSTAGALARWFRDTFASKEVSWQTLSAEAASAGAGAEGLMILPYWSGERTPINDPDARGVIAGLSLRHERGHIYRAILEGVAYGIRGNLEAMADAGCPPRRLVAIGGGTMDPLWPRIVTDVTGREQAVCTSPGASYGDAILAAVAVGVLPSLSASRAWLGPAAVIRPDAEATGFYDGRYEQFRALYLGTRETVHTLAAEASSSPRLAT